MKTKKELKEEHRRYKPIIGVFQIKNTLSGKVLIEGSTDINSKWNRYQMELKFGNHRNANLQKDWDEFKADNFTFTILSKLKYKEEENTNYSEEVKLLREMIIEELNIQKNMLY